MWTNLTEEQRPQLGQLVVCWYAKYDTYWAGKWHNKIACTKWMLLPPTTDQEQV